MSDLPIVGKGHPDSLALAKRDRARPDLHNQIENQRELSALESFRELVDHSLSGVLVHRNRKLLYANDAWCQIYGISREDATNLSSVDTLIHPDDRQRVVGYWFARNRGEPAPHTYDFRISHSSGVVRTLHTQILMMDWHGQTACYATVIDVTVEREREHAAMRNQAQTERERKLIGEAVEQASDGLIICDAKLPDQPIIFVNPAFAKITGYSISELKGSPYTRLQGPDTDPRSLEKLHRALRDGHSYNGEILNYKKDGTPFWNQLSISPIRDADGDLSHYVGTQRDITDEKTRNNALDMTRSALDQAYDRIAVLDESGRYVYANHALCERFGCPQEQLLGKTIADLIGQESYDEHIDPFLSLALAGEVITTTVALPKPDGSQNQIEYAATPFFGDDDQLSGVTVVSRDVTDEFNARKAEIENEKRFRDFASLGADIFIETDSTGEIQWSSDTPHAWSGWQKSLCNNKPFIDAISRGIDNHELSQLSDTFSAREDFHIEHHIEESDGTSHITEFQGSATTRMNGDHGYRIIGRDLTHQRKAEHELLWQSTHDEQTNLINRQEFRNQIRDRITSRKENCSHTLMFLDIDHLNVVNDSSGHITGDRMICHVAEFLLSTLTEGDPIVARIGGDEFAVFLSGAGKRKAEQIAHNIVDQAKQSQILSVDRSFTVGLSIGLAHLEDITGSLDDAIACADVACYQAKRLGRGRVAIYSDEDESLLRQRRVNRMDAEIRAALEENRFELHLQPIYRLDIEPSRIGKYEALVRMRDTSGKLIYPDDFIDAAEAYGLITDLDLWVTKAAIALLPKILNRACLAVNLSGKSVADANFADRVASQLEKVDSERSRLCFEITETAAIQHRDAAASFLHRLRQFGCNISLDDFGTGLSSFRYLQDFDVDEIKIDGSFIQDIVSSIGNQVLVKAIVDIAKGFDMKVVAEWVEDEPTMQLLRDMGVNYGQGYFFSKPLPADVILGEVQTPAHAPPQTGGIDRRTQPQKTDQNESTDKLVSLE